MLVSGEMGARPRAPDIIVNMRAIDFTYVFRHSKFVLWVEIRNSRARRASRFGDTDVEWRMAKRRDWFSYLGYARFASGARDVAMRRMLVPDSEGAHDVTKTACACVF